VSTSRLASRGGNVLLRLPDPMLARGGQIPTGRGWSFEPKLDGFRAIASTCGATVRVRSRRGWNMTKLLPELESLPSDVILDGD
jgi:ATP-dependent DNA ligase